MSAAVRSALIVPADLDQPTRVIEFTERELLDVLYREIGCDCVDSSPQLRTPMGALTMWVDDTGLLQPGYEHNDRAIATCRAFGYQVPDVAGTAVFTGGASPSGDTLGVARALLQYLTDAFADMAGVR